MAYFNYSSERFIYQSNATQCNMSQLIVELKGRQQVEDLCTKSSLNIELLKDFFMWRMKGFNNKEVAQKLGVHRVTVQRYAATLQKLKESEFRMLAEYIVGDRYETANSD